MKRKERRKREKEKRWGCYKSEIYLDFEDFFGREAINLGDAALFADLC